MMHIDMLNQVEDNIRKLQDQLAEAKINVEDTEREYNRAKRNLETITRLLELATKTKAELKAF